MIDFQICNAQRLIALVATLSLLVFPFKASAEETWAFVSIAGEQQIAAYSIDDHSPSLKLKTKEIVSGKPGAMCVSADGKFLYVAIREPGSIATYQIGDDAKLSLVSETNVGAGASYLTVHPDGKHLFSAYYQAGQIAVHSVSENGALAEQPLHLIKTDERAHCIQFEPSGKFVFIPHTRPNKIFQFVFDSESGSLHPNEIPFLQRKSGGPRHLWFKPGTQFAYGSDEQGCSVSQYQCDKESGQLKLVDTTTSLPDTKIEGKKSTSDIEVHPSGEFLFIANRGHNSIATFSIESQTGMLKLQEHADTEPVPRSFNVSPNGNHLVAAGQKSGKLALFNIGDGGKLDRIETIEAGKSPWWVLMIQR